MSKIQCKMCGGMLELPDDVTVGECPYCSSRTTFPKLDSVRKEQLYARAEHFRQANDFDRAIAAYEEIVREDSTDAEAYWGIVISRFGIEYVEDPVSHERIPTCHRVQYESILADADYKAALENAGGYERDIYEKEAQRIADIQKGILAVSSREEPFDVFICYKDTTDGGSRTKDSAIAQDIYYQLTNEGYKVFFSRITLEDKLGQQYEPYIFAALNSAKVMLVIGSKKEYFNAVWVKNEWSRFLQLMKKDRSKLLIPCYRDMDAYEIPDELSMLQSQDMGKVGFIQDLLRGIEKVMKAEEVKPTATTPTFSTQTSTVSPLMRRVEIFLQTNEFETAHQYCEKILDQEPENYQAYIYRLMAENEIPLECLLYRAEDYLEFQKTYRLAMQFADSEQRRWLQECVLKQKNEMIYAPLVKRFNDCQDEKLYGINIEYLYEKNSIQLYEKKIKQLSDLETDLARAISSFAESIKGSQCTRETRKHCQEYIKQCQEYIKQCQEHQIKIKYDWTEQLMNKFKYNEAMNLLMEIKEHPGSDQRIELCKKKLAEQEKQVAAVLRSLLVVVILVVAIITGRAVMTRRAEKAARKAENAARVNLLISKFEEAAKRKDKLAAEFLLATIAELSPADSHLGKLRGLVPDVPEPEQAVSLSLGDGVTLDLVLIRPGKFLMGSEKAYDEKPVHEVTISHSFYLGKYEVTQAQWEAVMGANPSEFKGANLPVESISWEDCQEFVTKLNSKGGGTFRLPTEAEWEYACRAGTTGDYAGSLDEMAWYDKNSGKKTHPVGTKKPNPWGLYDMHGNVREWCQDWFDYYNQGRQIDPRGTTDGPDRVSRGGGWCDDARACRSAYRNGYLPSSRYASRGFRLVMEIP